MSHNCEEKLSARERILAVAEQIFISGGFDGVSVRELTDAAGVNVALVNYYFGSKRNLYLEVLRRRFCTVAEKKALQLSRTLQKQQSNSLHGTISAYVMLYLGSDETMHATQQFLKLFTHQVAEDKDAMELLLQELIIPLHLLMRKTIKQSCPQLEQDKISLCIGSITGQIFHFLRFPSAFKTLINLPEGKNLREEMADHIISFSLKGIEEEPTCAVSP